MKYLIALLLLPAMLRAADYQAVMTTGSQNIYGTKVIGKMLMISSTGSLIINGTANFTPGAGSTWSLGNVTITNMNPTGGIRTDGTDAGLWKTTGSAQVGTTGTPIAFIRSGTGTVSWGLINADAEVTAYLAVASATNTGMSSVSIGWGAALDNGIYLKQALMISTGTIAIILGNEGTTSGGAVTVNNRTVRATVIQY